MAKRKPGKKKLAEFLSSAVDRAGELLEEKHIASEFLATAVKQGNQFIFDNGYIIKMKSVPWLGSTKTFYDVYNTKTRNYEARDLGLFMSAMGIIRSNQYTTRAMNSILIEKADQRYKHHLNDAAIFGHRIKTSNDSFKKELFLIRLEESLINCRQAKRELQSYI